LLQKVFLHFFHTQDMTMKKRIFALLAGAVFSTAALAQVTVTEPWVRATVGPQKSTGAFMHVQSATPARLVEARSPAAGKVEIHTMEMQGDTMKMKRVDGIDLPAGKVVNLVSGGYHIMLFNLKEPLKAGDKVPLTLVVQDDKQKRQELNLTVPVMPITHSAAKAGHSATH
jgi:copper(I)-binding protein